MAHPVKNLPAIQETEETQIQVPGLGLPPGAGNGDSLQYSCWENPKE